MQTGVGIMQMEAGLDTGPVRARAHADRGQDHRRIDTGTGQWGGSDREGSADLDAYPAKAQSDDGITYAHKIDKAEARLDFSADAAQVLRQIRAFMPAPGAFLSWRVSGIRCCRRSCPMVMAMPA
jgi:methionyl-tRNA formyltransferase